MKRKNDVIVTGTEVENSKWWKKIHIPAHYIFIGILIIVLIIAIYNYMAKPNANKFVCISGKSKIIIKYEENKILSLKKKNINFDIKEKNEETKMIEYLAEINELFYNMSGETCKINDNSLEILKENTLNENLAEDLYEVGNSYYGYVDIPESWNRYYEPSSKYLTFVNEIYSVSILYEEDYTGTVNEYFENYKKTVEDNFGIKEIKISSEIIGGSLDYIANVISYYDETYKKYYSTYIFADENNKVHYIEISGTESLNKILFIPKSFRIEPKRLY